MAFPKSTNLVFEPARLAEAIEVRRMKKSELAARVGVSPAAITQYVKGVVAPKANTLQLLAKELDLPVHFFLWPILGVATQPTYFRSLAAATKTQRNSASRKLGWIFEAYKTLSTWIEFPTTNVHTYLRKDIEKAIESNEMESIAAKVREHWGLGSGPIANLTLSCESNGIIVASLTDESAFISAFSRWFEDRAVIVNTPCDSAARNRFNIAHELGHLILHSQVSVEEFTTKGKHREIFETEANRFAAALLLPAKQFKALPFSTNLNYLLQLKRKWGVSLRAIVMRACELGLLDEARKQFLLITFNKRWGSKFEPIDDLLPVEVPSMMSEATRLATSENAVTKQELRAELPLSDGDMCEALGLPISFFNDPPVIHRAALRVTKM